MRFCYFEGCGNSFYIIEKADDCNYNRIAKEICNREARVDGLLVVDPELLFMRVFNNDGSEANMCGNGIRCVCHYLYLYYQKQEVYMIRTYSGVYKCIVTCRDPFKVKVGLGRVHYEFNCVKKVMVERDKLFTVSIAKLGVLHAIIVVESFDDLLLFADDISKHIIDNKVINVDFVKIINNKAIEVCTYEKGVGWTKSCGTGSAVSAFVLNDLYELDNKITILTSGGILEAEVKPYNVLLEGNSTFFKEREEKV